MITVVEQDRHFRNVDRLGAKVVQVVDEHFNQTLIISHICFRTMREKREAQRINGEMALNAVGGFVGAESFSLDAGGAGILHRLRVDD